MSDLEKAARQALDALIEMTQPQRTASESDRYKRVKAAMSALESALSKQAEPVVEADEPLVAMRRCDFEHGWGWYIDHPEFYADIEPDEAGVWSVYFREKSGKDAFGERKKQAEPMAEAALKDAFFKGFHSVEHYYGDVENSAEEAWEKFRLQAEPVVDKKLTKSEPEVDKEQAEPDEDELPDRLLQIHQAAAAAAASEWERKQTEPMQPVVWVGLTEVELSDSQRKTLRAKLVAADKYPRGAKLYAAPPHQQQEKPVVMQYIALCDAMRYSERKDELTSPEEHAESLVAEIERLKQAEPVLQTCNCRWDGDKQVQQCGLHHAHAVAIHEWAERAKKAEGQQAEPVQKTVPKLAPSSRFNDKDDEQASLRDLLIAAAAMAVVAVRQGAYEGAAWVADAVLEDHLAEQTGPVVDERNIKQGK